MTTADLQQQITARRAQFLARLPTVDEGAPAVLYLPVGGGRVKLVKDCTTQFLQWAVREFKPHSGQHRELAAAVLELKRRESQQ